MTSAELLTKIFTDLQEAVKLQVAHWPDTPGRNLWLKDLRHAGLQLLIVESKFERSELSLELVISYVEGVKNWLKMTEERRQQLTAEMAQEVPC